MKKKLWDRCDFLEINEYLQAGKKDYLVIIYDEADEILENGAVIINGNLYHLGNQTGASKVVFMSATWSYSHWQIMKSYFGP